MFNKDKVIFLMEQKGWTKYRLAKEAGLGQSTVHEILSGKKVSPNAKTLSKLADALDVSVDEFFNGGDSTEKDEIEIKESTDIALANMLDDDQILTLAANRAGIKGPLTEEEIEKIKLAIKIALINKEK